MTGKWTPGPWSVWKDDCADCGGEWGIREVPGGRHAPFVNQADAALCAAAPDLYAALAWYVENDETDTDTGFYAKGRERAKAALSKARGETP